MKKKKQETQMSAGHQADKLNHYTEPTKCQSNTRGRKHCSDSATTSSLVNASSRSVEPFIAGRTARRLENSIRRWSPEGVQGIRCDGGADDDR